MNQPLDEPPQQPQQDPALLSQQSFASVDAEALQPPAPSSPAPQPPAPQPTKDEPWIENPPWSAFDLLMAALALLVGTVVFSGIAIGVLMTTPQLRGTNIHAVTEHPSMYIVVPAMGAAYAVMLTVLYLLAVVRQQPFWKSLSWNWPRNMRWLGFLFAGTGLSLVAGGLQKVLPTPKNLPIEDMFREPGAAWFLAALGVLVAPFVEEILFRGLLYPIVNRWLVSVLYSRQRIRRGRLIFLLLVPWGFAAHGVSAKVFLLITVVTVIVAAIVFLIRLFDGDFAAATRAILLGLVFIAWGQVASYLSQRGLVIASLGLLVAVVLLTLLGLKLQPGTNATNLAVALSVVTTAAAFAMVHGQQLAQSWSPLLVLFVVGVVLTLARAATKSVASSFLIHLGYNFTLFGGLYFVTDHFRHMERMVQ